MNADMKITSLRVDGFPPGTLFCASRRPAFSWRMESDFPGAAQREYRIIARDADHRVLWDSGTVADARSAGIEWDGAPLASRQHVFWQVAVWDQAGNTALSEEAEFETALFENAEWQGCWILRGHGNTSAPAPCPMFRKEFTAAKPLRQARLYAACRGVMECYLNGRLIGNEKMMPGWTDFNRRIQYLAYDVTSMLRNGANVLGAIAGDGWYCSYLCGRQKNHYGNYPGMLLQLELTYADGSRQQVVTDSSWKCSTGPLLYSDIYDGEFYDARLEMPHWAEAGFDESNWTAVQTQEAAKDSPLLELKCAPPVRVVSELPARRLLHPAPDIWIWDLGQNIAGGIRLENLRSWPGGLYTIHYAEMLNADGTLYNLNYRNARSTDYYTARGIEGVAESYETRFTFHGFRYIQIDGFQFNGASPEELLLTGLAIASDLETTASFECGNPKLNRLWQNVFWGQRSNFLEIPTDCPQRDERLGWTGDAEIFCGTAAINMNVAGFFRKYLTDLRDAQREDGAVSCIAPDIRKRHYGAAGWADAAVVCPWTIYQAYGDKRILSENLGMMCRWVDYMERTSDHLIRPATSFGDWLALAPTPTPSELIGTAYFAFSAELTASAAAELGRVEEEKHYRALAAKVRQAFCRSFTAGGMVSPATQTALALALHFRLLPEAARRPNAALLARLVRENGGKLNTGFIGTAYLNLSLSENGEAETACRLYCQEEFPSWLFSVNQGATTVWERWNSYTVKEGFGEVSMNSFNHCAYGAVEEWAIRHLAGIDAVSPGGRKVRFAAEPAEKLGFVRASLTTPYGKWSSFWEFREGRVHWEISAPANTEMTVVIPENWFCEQPAGNLPCGHYCLVLTPKER